LPPVPPVNVQIQLHHPPPVASGAITWSALGVGLTVLAGVVVAWVNLATWLKW
jgi:hypothetical protein